MINCLKVCRLLLLALCLILLLAGCFLGPFVYAGDYPELYSVAVNSMLGQRGHTIGYPGGGPPYVRKLEEDSFGRLLFIYGEATHPNAISPANLVIMQKAEDGYAYFYPHYNFISSDWQFSDEDDEDTELLKEANNWNQELSDSNNFVRVRISRRKATGPISDNILIQAHRDIFPDSNSSRGQIIGNMIFLREDDFGRSVYHIGGARDSVWSHFAFLFQPDHSFDMDVGILEITDVLEYQTELRLFMEANGWNTPFD